ncbi:hypothetical protein ACIQC5_11920 [Paenarthrobacter sp. NPDC092416]|uniref:hypothetical protein n=1 Tax=Paenarthrobacter sp. NPDC092416 TaxID=3364386 RepID=UPI00380432A8
MKSRYLIYGVLVVVALVLAVVGFVQGAPPLQSWSLLIAAVVLAVVAVMARRRRKI